MGDSFFIRRSRLKDVEDSMKFFMEMFRRGRAVAISKDGEIKTLCAFFILKNEQACDIFYRRPIWSTPLDFPEGGVCYIDKIVGLKFDKEIFKGIEEAILRRFPKVKTGIWYRDTNSDDRKVLYSPITKRVILNAIHISDNSSIR